MTQKNQQLIVLDSRSNKYTLETETDLKIQNQLHVTTEIDTGITKGLSPSNGKMNSA